MKLCSFNKIMNKSFLYIIAILFYIILGFSPVNVQENTQANTLKITTISKNNINVELLGRSLN